MKTLVLRMLLALVLILGMFYVAQLLGARESLAISFALALAVIFAFADLAAITSAFGAMLAFADVPIADVTIVVVVVVAVVAVVVAGDLHLKFSWVFTSMALAGVAVYGALTVPGIKGMGLAVVGMALLALLAMTGKTRAMCRHWCVPDACTGQCRG